MKKKLAILTPILVLMIGLFTMPAFAKDGGGDSGGNGGNGGSGDSQTSTASGSSSDATKTDTNSKDSSQQNDQSKQSDSQKTQEAEVEHESNQDAKHTLENSLESEGDDVINNLLKDHKKHSDDERKKNCQAAEHGLENKLQNLSTNATAFQKRIDTALTLAIAYQKDNNINVANFDQLVTAAQTAQGKAAASVSVLNGLSTNLDCTQNTVASNVAQFQVAAKQARTDLLSYKTAVRAVLQALEMAKEGN